jgi:hypothetical protein
MKKRKKVLEIFIFILIFSILEIIIVSGARLPTVNSDIDNWGTVLNEFLRTEHDASGGHTDITATDLMTKGPWADVRAFGAMGDGVTDDTAAIQEAINSGKKVYIPIGTYSVSTLKINVSDIIIIGDGMAKTNLVASGTEPIFNISSIRPELKDLTINGNNIANYGIYAQDIGSIQGRFIRIEIKNVTGTPGIGFANVDRSYSMLFDRCWIHSNKIGIKLIKRYQNTVIDHCLIYYNTQEQVHLGDGTQTTRMITISNSELEGGASGGAGTTDVTNLAVNKVDPLILNSVYFESYDTFNSTDIHVTGESRIEIDGMYSNGNSITDNSIVLDSSVNLTIQDSTFINFVGDVIANDTSSGKSVNLFNVNLDGSLKDFILEGDMGVGTTIPIHKMDVLESDGSATNVMILRRGTQSGGDQTIPITFGKPLLKIGGIEWRNVGGYAFYGIGFGYGTSVAPAEIGLQATSLTGGSKGDLVFGLRDTTTASDIPVERMRITSAGKVGIGTNSPSAGLDINKTTIVPLKLASNTTAITCNSTNAGGIIYSGGKHYGCNGTDWNALY